MFGRSVNRLLKYKREYTNKITNLWGFGYKATYSRLPYITSSILDAALRSLHNIYTTAHPNLSKQRCPCPHI